VSKVFVKSLLLTMFAALILTACGATAAPSSAYPNPSYPNPVIRESATLAVSGDALSGDVSFANDVLPIFESRCFSCHGGDKTEKGLDLKTYDSVMLGSQNGAVISVGNADNSPLFMAVSSGKMPRRGPKLTPQQLDLIKKWINSGAPNN
jgi:mono/diheme cytochrome c family protein